MKPIPSLNVNLAKCDTPHLCAANGGAHVSVCAARVVLIPCRIPDSFTCWVVGECADSCRAGLRAALTGGNPDLSRHHDRCPGKPIRVSCSITSDGAWAGSEVVDVGTTDPGLLTLSVGIQPVLRACSERWALVKALVMGASRVSEFPEPFRMVPAVSELLGQRNVVYAALCDMARAEEAACVAQKRADEAFPFSQLRRDDADHRAVRPSSVRMAAYVEHVVEQVGAL